VSYQQATLATLKARLADRYESVPYWSAAEATSALNEGLRIYSCATGFWREEVLTVTVPNDHYVALPGSMVQGTRVKWNDLALEPVSRFDLDYQIPNWRGTTTATSGAPSRPLYWARVSLTSLLIYPADAYASVGGTHALSINGVRNTPILVNDADFVDLGQELFDVLLGYATHVLAFKLGGDALVSTYPGWLAFLAAAAKENREFAATTYYRKLMGLDHLRRLQPPERAADSLVAAQLQTEEAAL